MIEDITGIILLLEQLFISELAGLPMLLMKDAIFYLKKLHQFKFRGKRQ